jgi:phosphate transport system substrate-binding protein
MANLIERWQKGFHQTQPGVQFENHMLGALSAIGGLYTGVADLALSREIWPTETMAFEQVLGYKPTAIQVATGSFDVPTKSDSLEIFVHKDNPISKLTLSRLAAIFSAEYSPGIRSIRLWGDLGLKGDWSDKPIHGYAYQLDNAGSRFFRDVVLNGSQSWNCNIQGFANGQAADGSRLDAGRLILEALSKDRYGIAMSNLHYARPDVRALSLAVQDAGPFVAPTKESIQDRTYPLTRAVYVFLNRGPNRPLGATLREFMTYILSADGQRDVISEGGYIPLPAKILAEQLAQNFL